MYRAELLRCGYCGTLMEVVPVPVPGGEAALTDVCPACSSVFLEYFDGEPIGLATRLLALRPDLASADNHDRAEADETDAQQPPAASFGRAGSRTPNLAAEPAPGHCPGCGGTEVTPLRYLDGPPVSRCHDCLSLSATRAQLVLLAGHQVRPDATGGFWSRVLGWLGW